ncbi:transporter substrate-binding domain-containing protein [Pseudodesulfovibrio indicus]|uniref:substrate-binding periplasmic protein n=1 Tax=Pseudodesulfovibrio indicus TaxID=1716143 RepID=UPI00292E0E54|nr:transporter substrate-binding domain-containing protein [Pseudodesulfovibrio indicus]
MAGRRGCRRGLNALGRIAAVVALALLLTVRAASALDEIVLTSGDWPPYYSPELAFGGAANQVVSESFALAGVHASFVFVPWRRALEMARTGKAQGSAGWMRMANRERDFLFSDPLFESVRVFFHRKDMPFDWRSLDDVRDLRVAVTLGSAEEFPLEEVLARGTGRLDIAQDYASGMKKLLLGRVDVYACNLAVGLFILDHRVGPGASAIIYHPRPIFSETNHLLLDRNLVGAEELMARFNEGLRKLRESGRYDVIFRDIPALP